MSNPPTAGAILATAIINSPNIEALADFYRQGLELGEPNSSPDHLGFVLPNTYLGFDRVAEPPAAYPGATSLWFEVDDLAATFDRFVALGAPVRYPPTHKPWGGHLAAVYDPDGNIVGLSQRREQGE